MTPEQWKQIEEIYHGAEALPENERQAFLDQACRENEALRLQVETLLKEAVSAGFLAEPAAVRGAHLFVELSAPARVGHTIGSYRIEGLLGVGGMGEVYQAIDSRLGRSVAIKILPTAFSTDPDRVARLDREARILATLNHPNICAIYEIEEIDGIKLLVLELVGGQTLAERIASQGASGHPGLALVEALTIARQITDALEAAHEKGIVHRDLKPANIRITADGTVKILDFGLAKSVTGDSTEDLTLAPHTLSSNPRHGIVMGTAAYMSPEQARGLPVDRRTDIWAFGCVLYEMLTGRVAFAGDTISDSIAKVLEREPDWSALPAGTPVAIRRLLFRSLAKDLKKRLKDISDVRLEIDAIDEHVPGVTDQLSRTPATTRAWLPWTLAAVTTIGLVVMAFWPSPPPPAPLVHRSTQILPKDQLLNGSRGQRIVAVSPDGVLTAYPGRPHGLYVRRLSELDSKVVPGTETYEVSEPVFSPDSREIAFFSFADQAIMKISVTGGGATMLCPATVVYGMRWDSEGLVFGQGKGGIKQVPAGGGNPKTLITVTGAELHGPQILPDGDSVLYTLARGTAQNRWDRAQIVVQSLKTPTKSKVILEGSDAQYLPSGDLVYAFSGSLYALRFDPQSWHLTGKAVPVVKGIRRAAGANTGAAVFAASTSGTLVYVEGPLNGGASAPNDLALMKRNGDIEPLNLTPGPYRSPRISPNDSRVAFESDDGKEKIIYTYELSGRSRMQRLRGGGGNDQFPIWASDSRIVFQSDRGGSPGIWWQELDGEAEQLTTPEPGTEHAPESWHAGTGTLLYSVTKGPDVSLRTYSPKDHKTERFNAMPSSATMGATFRPDGKWIAYASTQQSRVTLFIQGFPLGPTYQLQAIASDAPHNPRWSHDGKELCYDPNLNGGFKCVPITTEPSSSGNPFGNTDTPPLPRNIRSNPPGLRTNYDIAQDGSLVGLITYGMKKYVPAGSDTEIKIVVNWYTELKAKTGR